MSYPTWGGMDHIARDREAKVKEGVSRYRKSPNKKNGQKKEGFLKKWIDKKRKRKERAAGKKYYDVKKTEKEEETPESEGKSVKAEPEEKPKEQAVSLKEAVIWSEILGEPVSVRRRKKRMERLYGN